jgi:hypothetical protein
MNTHSVDFPYEEPNRHASEVAVTLLALSFVFDAVARQPSGCSAAGLDGGSITTVHRYRSSSRRMAEALPSLMNSAREATATRPILATW